MTGSTGPDRGSAAIRTLTAADWPAVARIYQAGIDTGDATWRWFFGRRSWGTERTKDLSVRWNGDGTVKSYAFTSNFPNDLTRLK